MQTLLPSAQARLSAHDGGSMTGGNAFLTWHSFEADPKHLSAIEGAKRLIAAGTEVHFCLNPLSGDLVQILPADRAGRGLRNPPGGVQTNRAGRVHLQCEVIAFAAAPFTSVLTPAGRAALHRLTTFARSLGVPDRFPAGAPAAPGTPHHRVGPGPSGHYGHSQWRENDHEDPGRIDVAALFGPPAPAQLGPATHVVVHGDTLFALAQRFHTTVAVLAALNGIADPDVIPVGMVLRLPVAA